VSALRSLQQFARNKLATFVIAAVGKRAEGIVKCDF